MHHPLASRSRHVFAAKLRVQTPAAAQCMRHLGNCSMPSIFLYHKPFFCLRRLNEKFQIFPLRKSPTTNTRHMLNSKGEKHLSVGIPTPRDTFRDPNRHGQPRDLRPITCHYCKGPASSLCIPRSDSQNAMNRGHRAPTKTLVFSFPTKNEQKRSPEESV